MGLHYKDAEQMQTLVSEEFGDWSDPLTIDQAMIDDYAALSGDDMWMHVDVERCAKESPYGCTIAHGFLVLSLLPKMPGKNNWIASVEGAIIPMIASVQVSDWKPNPRCDNDRALPGDGIIPLAGILQTLEDAGYRGSYEMEIWSQRHWKSDTESLVTTCRDRFGSLLEGVVSQ